MKTEWKFISISETINKFLIKIQSCSFYESVKIIVNVIFMIQEKVN